MTLINLNMDFSKPILIDCASPIRESSPQSGVERVKLERLYEESGHATSLVRYQANSHFPRHAHPTGEEFFVLEGVFSDEHGHYPSGSYVRNPPGSSHQPFTKDGCTLFVKLCQMEQEETQRCFVDTATLEWHNGVSSGHYIKELFHNDREVVTLQKFIKGTCAYLHTQSIRDEGLLIKGCLLVDGIPYSERVWWRYPKGHQVKLDMLSDCIFWCKRLL